LKRGKQIKSRFINNNKDVEPFKHIWMVGRKIYFLKKIQIMGRIDDV